MKKNIKTPLILLAGIIIGLAVFGFIAFVENMANEKSKFLILIEDEKIPVIVDGKPVSVDAYLFNNTSYIQMREFASLLDVGVSWDDDNKTLMIDTDKKYGEE